LRSIPQVKIRGLLSNLFVELREPVFRYLRTLGCRHWLAEEITQEALLRLHRRLTAGNEIADARAWVFRVARNLWIDNRREHQRYPIIGLEDGEHPELSQIGAVPDPEQQILRRERLQQIEEELLRLPQLQRDCMNLKAEGLRYHEIAATLNVSLTMAVECVRSATRRINRRLKL
jgi:RNA polymerase sigma-70 factor (ECF subfamily)